MSIIVSSCIEEVDLGIGRSERAKGILIVEGKLTNEVSNHRIVLSKIDTLLDLQIDSVFNPFTPIRDIDRDLIPYEENANVIIVDGSGTIFPFLEVSPGNYESIEPFGAQIGTTYRLQITTADGIGYTSKEMALHGLAEIENIYAEKTISDAGEEGIGIFIDNTTKEGSVNNLRFTYDETYKIVAPFWDENDFKLTNYDPCALPVPTYDLEIVPREEEQQVCYGNALSNTIIQARQPNSDTGSLKRFMVRFISKNNFILSHRYSIEVTQQVSSEESFGFYEQLNNFSQSGSVFSQIQPGFLEGNLSANNGQSGLVIGFFDVVSISKKRLFFNFTDIYPGESLPPFIFNCGELSSPESHVSYCFPGLAPGGCPQSIIEQVNLDLISYVRPNEEGLGSCPGPHIFVFRICGDCTLLGSNIKPDFWID